MAKLYVDIQSERDGDGSRKAPFRSIQEAAKTACPGDTVIVAPGVYREYVNPPRSGKENARITFVSEKPLGAVITGAENAKGWSRYEGDVWVLRIDKGIWRL